MAESGKVRAEIQALRALAVGLVAAFHFYPAAIRGGFLGVDAFFVVSGFLITGGLLRDAGRLGRLPLADFWARRARRLLPASLTVLLLATAGTLLLAPPTWHQQTLIDAFWASGYALNWRLSWLSWHYWQALQAQARPSALEHYWTLSMEEQFYLAWPLLLALGFRVRGRGGAAAAAILAALASLAYSLSRQRPYSAGAYFQTGARAWEFAAGGLLAFWGDGTGRSAPLRAAVSWAGVAALTTAAFASSKEGLDCGALLLAVGATAAVIWAGDPPGAWSPSRWMRLPLVQELGALSYSLYLWHWPILTLAIAVLGPSLGGLGRAAAMAASVAAAVATKRLLEDPVRFGSLSARAPRATLTLAAVGLLASLGASWAARTAVEARFDRGDAALARRHREGFPPCFGAASRDPERPCVNPALRGLVLPAPFLVDDRAAEPPARTLERLGMDPIEELWDQRRPTAVALLIGDSHAWVLRGAFAAAARRLRWRALALTRCGLALAPAQEAVCQDWSARALSWLSRHPEIDTVIAVQHFALPGQPPRDHDQARDGFARALRALPDSVRRVVVVPDNPTTFDLDCAARALKRGSEPAACGDPRATALPPDPAVEAAEADRSGRVSVLDLTDLFCDARRCPHVIGGALVHRDADHLTRLYALTLAPILARRLERLAPRP